jgi:hypothetical protein
MTMGEGMTQERKEAIVRMLLGVPPGEPLPFPQPTLWDRIQAASRDMDYE